MIKMMLLFFVCSLSMTAQTLPEELDTPRERADRLTSEMIQKMSLLNHQIAPIDSLNLSYAKLMQEEVLDKDLSAWGQYWTGSKIMNRKDVEMKKVLSVEQFSAYQKFKSDVMYEILGSIF